MDNCFIAHKGFKESHTHIIDSKMKISTMGIYGNLNQSINLNDLAALGPAVQITKYRGYLALDKKIKACIYKTGNIQIYGNKDIDSVQKLWENILATLRLLNPFPNADKKACIKYIVASDKLPYSLNLHDISNYFSTESIEYEPEQFTGLIWRLDGGTCLLFTSGNIVIVGPNSIEKIEKTIAALHLKLDPLFL